MKENETHNRSRYVFRCDDCSCQLFHGLQTGYIQCAECSAQYSFIHAMGDWVPKTISTEEFIRLKYNKIWDEETKSFRPLKEVLIKQQLKTNKKNKPDSKKED